MNSFIRKNLCVVAFASGVLVLGAGAASADTGATQALNTGAQTGVSSMSSTADRGDIASDLGANLWAGADLSSTLHTNGSRGYRTGGTNTGSVASTLGLGAGAGLNTNVQNNASGQNRGSVASASNLGVNLGANATTATTVQNNTTGTTGTDRGSVASASNLGLNLGLNAGLSANVQNHTAGGNSGLIGG